MEKRGNPEVRTRNCLTWMHTSVTLHLEPACVCCVDLLSQNPNPSLLRSNQQDVFCTQAEPLTFTKRKRVSLDDDRLSSQSVLSDDKYGSVNDLGGEGMAVEGEVGEESELGDGGEGSELGEMDDAEHLSMVDEVRAQLEELAAKKHTLMLNLKRVCTSFIQFTSTRLRGPVKTCSQSTPSLSYPS